MSIIKLAFGCGHIDLHNEGYINVDVRRLQHVDIVTDVGKRLPFDDNYADEILADSVLEHIPHNDETGNCNTPYHKTFKVLKEWYRVLKPNGLLSVKVPNLRAIFHEYYCGRMSVKDWLMYTYGGEEYGGGCDKCNISPNTHMSGFEPELALKIFSEVGFRDIKLRNAHDSNHPLDYDCSWEMRILAIK